MAFLAQNTYFPLLKQYFVLGVRCLAKKIRDFSGSTHTHTRKAISPYPLHGSSLLFTLPFLPFAAPEGAFAGNESGLVFQFVTGVTLMAQMTGCGAPGPPSCLPDPELLTFCLVATDVPRAESE